MTIVFKYTCPSYTNQSANEIGEVFLDQHLHRFACSYYIFFMPDLKCEK